MDGFFFVLNIIDSCNIFVKRNCIRCAVIKNEMPLDSKSKLHIQRISRNDTYFQLELKLLLI